jgi:hypothetical protein
MRGAAYTIWRDRAAFATGTAAQVPVEAPDELEADVGQVACMAEKHMEVPTSQHQVPVPTQVFAQSESMLHDPMQPELDPVPTPGLVPVPAGVVPVPPPPVVVVPDAVPFPVPPFVEGLAPAPVLVLSSTLPEAQATTTADKQKRAPKVIVVLVTLVRGTLPESNLIDNGQPCARRR